MAKKAAVKRVVKRPAKKLTTEAMADQLVEDRELSLWKEKIADQHRLIEVLYKQLRVAESVRETQVEDLLRKQAELMTDIAELQTRCVKVEE